MNMPVRKTPISIDEFSEEFKARLIAGETVELCNQNYSFSDVLQFTWDDIEKLDAVDEAIHMIAKGEFIEGAEKIHEIIMGTKTQTGTAGEFVDALLEAKK
jgi:hypothetical protein